MASQNEVLRGLEEASQKQEKEIVLDLGPDRILHYVGVYVVLALAALTKISELAGNNLSCYPATAKGGFDSDFISYIRAYCWESSDFSPDDWSCTQDGCTPRNNSCELQKSSVSENKLLQNPALVKGFLQWIPYVMLLEAILFAIPTAWWHFRVGARLMGHLKFMKLLLNDIYETIKSLPIGYYERKPYDGESNYLNAWRRFEPPKTENQVEQSRASDAGGVLHGVRKLFDGTCARKRRGDKKTHVGDVTINVPDVPNITQSQSTHGQVSGGGNGASATEQMELIPNTPTPSDAPTGSQGTEQHKQQQKEEHRSDDEDPNSKESTRGFWSRFFFGDMRDRHLFSMICFENFSSLEHHPYILSIFQLTEAPDKGDKEGNMPMKQGILRQMCHEDNFKGNFLIRSYVWKHIIGIVLSLLFLITASVVFSLLGSDSWGSESFQCDVIYHEELCVICTMHRKRDMFALFIVNLIIIAGYLLLSIGHWLFIRSAARRASSFYLEDIKGTGSLAILAASDL